MNRLLISTLLLSCSILISCAGIERGPLERFQQPNVESAKILEQSLSDSEWLYSWRGNQYNFRFNGDGSIGMLESWKNVNWYVSGKEEVVLEGEHSKMLLSFNSDVSTFFTRDWDGEESDGRRVAK